MVYKTAVSPSLIRSIIIIIINDSISKSLEGTLLGQHNRHQLPSATATENTPITMQVSSMDPEQGHLPAAATTTTATTRSRRRRRGLSSRLCAAVPPAARNHAVAALAELAGTFLFLLFAFGGTNAVNTAAAASGSDGGSSSSNVAADPAKLLVISLSFGVSLAVNAWAFFRVSGGMFNPAVTLGLMVVGAG